MFCSYLVVCSRADWGRMPWVGPIVLCVVRYLLFASPQLDWGVKHTLWWAPLFSLCLVCVVLTKEIGRAHV